MFTFEVMIYPMFGFLLNHANTKLNYKITKQVMISHMKNASPSINSSSIEFK